MSSATSSPSAARSRPRSLDPVTYARGHAMFEARSNQRDMIIDWLDGILDERADATSMSVLSVGCGDGSVDGALAGRACARSGPAARRRWTGVDPHPPNTAAFSARLGALAEPRLGVDAHACTFAEFRTRERFDAAIFVHSLYYVGDVGEALRAATALLRPGGELLVLHAPCGDLNRLSAALAPRTAGRRQPWSGTVADELAMLGARVHRTELDARVDLTGCADADPALLDFTVQAGLDPATRAQVVAELERIAEPGQGLRVAHPVTAFRVDPVAGAFCRGVGAPSTP